MAQKHNSVKRIMRRCTEELRATREIARVESIGDALITFFVKAIIQAVNRGWIVENGIIRKLLLRKHEIMRKYFETVFAEYLRKYDFDRLLPEEGQQFKNTIWLCWWQGEENAPEITKKCIESVRRNAGEHPVIVINETNYKQYVQMPAWVEEKYKAGIISRTHYSDILRLSLLSNYGGLWLDATMYCTAPVLNTYLKMPLWTMKRPGCDHLSVAGGRFATNCLGCDWEHRYVSATIRDFLLQYWQENDLLIDYLIFDYMIDLAIRNDIRIAECFDAIEPNNPNGIELLKLMGKPFDEAAWKTICKKTRLFKLSWKRTFPTEMNGVDTFYGKLMKDKL